METVIAGKILKPRGLGGEIKCSLFGIEFQSAEVYIDGKKYKVLNQSTQNGFTYLKLDGVAAVEQAERLRGKNIEVDASKVQLATDEILVTDLIGFEIVGLNGGTFGRVKNVEYSGAGVIIEYGTDSAFPYEDAFVTETNMIDKKIVVREDMLECESIF